MPTENVPDLRSAAPPRPTRSSHSSISAVPPVLPAEAPLSSASIVSTSRAVRYGG